MTRKIIIDTDPGVDDAMAILLALRSPELELVGLSTIFGNSNVDATTRNALNLLHIAGRADIPVARGSEAPLVNALGGTAEWVHGDDAMGNIGWTKPLDDAQKPHRLRAAEFIVQQVMAHPGEITLVPIGPLTNLALALRLEPRIARNVREVVMMGGSVLAPGNVSPLAEANVHGDPHAASLVFSANWDVVMAGLDVTESIHANNTLWSRFAASRDPQAQFIARIIGFYQDFHAKWYGFTDGSIYMHDACAVAYLLQPDLFETADWAINVPHDGPAAGATIADRRGKFFTTPKVKCMLKVDEPRILELLASRLT